MVYGRELKIKLMLPTNHVIPHQEEDGAKE
jgi:hypothetical protein